MTWVSRSFLYYGISVLSSVCCGLCPASPAPEGKKRCRSSVKDPPHPTLKVEERELDRGGEGTVHAAEDTATGALYAVKFLDEFSDSPVEPGYLPPSCYLALPLFHGIFDTDSRAKYGHAFELFAGSVKDMLDTFGEVSLAAAAHILRSLLSGLQVLHANKLAHCDVKPGNLFVRPDGSVALGDFGLTRSHVGEILEQCTPGFEPPEFCDHSDATDKRTFDVFAVGKVAELLCRKGIDIHLDDLVVRCTNRDPDLRPDVTELLLHPFISLHCGEDTPSYDTTKEIVETIAMVARSKRNQSPISINGRMA